jgi:putative transposase
MLDFQPSPSLPRYAFGAHDEILINGLSYRCNYSTDEGYVFVRTDGTGVAESFTHAVLSQYVTQGKLEHRREAFLSDRAKRRLRNPASQLATLPRKQLQKVREREAIVRAFLKKEVEGKVKRTEESVRAVRSDLLIEAGKILSVPCEDDPSKMGSKKIIVPVLSASRILKLVASFDRDGMSALCSHGAGQGNRTRRLSPDTIALLAGTVRNYLSMERPSKTQIYDDVCEAFHSENIRRREMGKSDLITPSRETVRQEIEKLDPFLVNIARYGEEEARKRTAPVGRGIEVTRPLERVEMDEWKVDLMTLLAGSGIWSILSEEERASFGLEEGETKRWYLTVALCTTTRCILAMKLSRIPSKRSAMQAIEMIVRDKGVWADAVGALCPWNMCGTPELIVTDCGSAFIDFNTRAGATDLGIAIENAPAGVPELRAKIERVFGTISSKLMGRFTGRTFSNSVIKGDYDPKARAALTAEDLSEALIRWIVDVYHNTPHSGLNGDTPFKCWHRLVALHGVNPMPSVRSLRQALGTRLKRTITKKGITVLGIQYHSEKLAHWFMHYKNKEVRVRWHSEDLGAISVELNNEWIEVPSVFSRFNGERAQTWLMAVRELRASAISQAHVDEEIIFSAMRRIKEINANAIARQGAFVDDFSEKRISQLEDGFLIGFNVAARTEDPQFRPSSDGFGLELPLDACIPSHIIQKPKKMEAEHSKDFLTPSISGVSESMEWSNDQQWSIGKK